MTIFIIVAPYLTTDGLIENNQPPKLVVYELNGYISSKLHPVFSSNPQIKSLWWHTEPKLF